MANKSAKIWFVESAYMTHDYISGLGLQGIGLGLYPLWKASLLYVWRISCLNIMPSNKACSVNLFAGLIQA